MYSVVVAASALDDIASIYRRLAAETSDPAYPERWLAELLGAMSTLRESPFRCSRSPEDRYFVPEIRHLIRGRYRVLFTVESTAVHILHVRHERQDTLRPE